MDVIRILIAIILPPVGVFLQVGLGLHFWINILLTLCGYVPGIIHAIWISCAGDIAFYRRWGVRNTLVRD